MKGMKRVSYASRHFKISSLEDVCAGKVRLSHNSFFDQVELRLIMLALYTYVFLCFLLAKFTIHGAIDTMYGCFVQITITFVIEVAWNGVVCKVGENYMERVENHELECKRLTRHYHVKRLNSNSNLLLDVARWVD